MLLRSALNVATVATLTPPIINCKRRLHKKEYHYRDIVRKGGDRSDWVGWLTLTLFVTGSPSNPVFLHFILQISVPNSRGSWSLGFFFLVLKSSLSNHTFVSFLNKASNLKIKQI